ncbi:testisin [Trichonephila inaurata madagascariensis]|uniref:Testisin n=1 Tax=Trichonephila inaurata madagascariensis TaxID=2747483 RepID=A0A8X6Y101_9ARAC|nr:testisin [Trichonephila inaurata madagascariensis]
MHTIFGLLVIVLANTWAHPSTSASILTDFPETMVTEVPIGSFTEDNVTVTTTVVTESTRSGKYETERNASDSFYHSNNFQTLAPKRQCGRRFARHARIVGGSDAYLGEFPWAVSVRLLTTHFCGGVIISKTWVLTAAHCVKRYSARYFRVRQGAHVITKDGFLPQVDIHVAEVSIHPKFGMPRRYSNDLALLRLKKPFTFDTFTQPICLPDPDQDYEGRNGTVVGWGWMNEIEKRNAEKLQKVRVPVLNNSLCEKWYREVHNGYVRIYDYQICAGYKEGGKDACQVRFCSSSYCFQKQCFN